MPIFFASAMLLAQLLSGNRHYAPNTASAPCAAPQSDSFAGSAATPLATHNACWATMDSTYLVSNATIISSGVIGGASFQAWGAVYSGDSSDTAQFVVKGSTSSTVENNIAVCVRATSNSTYGYCGLLAGLSAGAYSNVQIKKNGTYLSASLCTITSSTADHTLKIVASGSSTTTISAYVDGTLCGTPVTDSSSPILSGSPGVYMYNNANQLDSTAGAFQDN